MAQDDAGASGILLAGGAALVALIAFWAFLGLPPYANVDDSFIVATYVRHWVTDGALYWNAGQGPVEGFTSLLDLLLKSALVRASSTDIVRVSWWLALVGHLGTALAVYAFAWRAAAGAPRARRLATALLGGTAVATCLALARSANGMLETPLYALLVALAACTLAPLRDVSAAATAGTALLGVLLVMVRPEGLVPALAFAGYHAVRLRTRPLRAATPLLAVALALALLLAWRAATFGQLAPNSYFAKTSASRWREIVDGARYVLSTPWLALVLSPLPWLAARWPDAADGRFFALLALLALGLTGVVVFAGGDCYPGARFLAVPALLALAAWTWAGARLARQRRVALAFVSGLLLLQLAAHALASPAKIASLRWLTPNHSNNFGEPRYLAERLAALHTDVGQSDFQALKFFADAMLVHDLHGINDARIARMPVAGSVRFGKFTTDVARERSPGILILGWELLHTAPLAARDLAALPDDPEACATLLGEFPCEPAVATFASLYRPASLPLCGRYYNFLVRNDVAERAARAGIWVRGRNTRRAASPAPPALCEALEHSWSRITYGGGS